MRRTPVFWALVLIALGVLLLLRETVESWRDVSVGALVLIAIGAWLLLARPWYGPFFVGRFVVPAALIAIGVVILLRDLRVLPGDFSVAPVVLIAIGAAILIAALPRVQGASPPILAHAIPYEGESSARVEIHHAAGRLVVGPMEDPAKLLEGTFAGGVAPDVRRGADRVEVTLRQRFGSWRGWGRGGARGFEWAVSLNRNVPLSLDVRSGASSARLELKDLDLRELDLQTGASQADLVLPERGHTAARVKAGAAQVRIRIPPGVAARIRTRRGLASVGVDTTRFPPHADGYRSPDYDAAENRVDLDIEAGAADVSVS
jgi:hypothetical protein